LQTSPVEKDLSYFFLKSWSNFFGIGPELFQLQHILNKVYQEGVVTFQLEKKTSKKTEVGYNFGVANPYSCQLLVVLLDWYGRRCSPARKWISLKSRSPLAASFTLAEGEGKCKLKVTESD